MTDSANHETLATATISDAELATIQALKRSGWREQRSALVIFHRDGGQVVPLVDGQSLVVGRFAPADVTIRDSSLSRQHASVELIDGKVWVEDLDSTNGTWIRGTRIDRQQLEPGDEVAFGTVTAVLQVAGASDTPTQGIDGHERFRTVLAAELQRSHLFGRTAALLMLRATGRARGHLASWLPAARKLLRPFDSAALYSGDTVEILLPECNGRQAAEVGQQLVAAADDLCCGAALYPDHAGSVDELFDRCRLALHASNRQHPVQITARCDDTEPAATSAAGPLVASPAMRALFEKVPRLGSTVIPVLILGETGTGKEVLARAIHGAGKRAQQPIVCVNCGAIPETLVESQLFGHEKGAFTGANQQHAGVFEAASGGTVFLDEIGELPLPAQAALLRVLESKRIVRVGATREIDVDVRVIAATHRNLEAMCRDKRFREDLLYRLNAMTLNIPPLRERREEIALFARSFMDQANLSNGCQVRGIDDDALELLARYAWPGNIRELKNAIERAVVLAQEAMITADDLPDRVRELARAGNGAATAAAASAGDAAAAGPKEDTAEGAINLRLELERYEAELIARVLGTCDWNRTEAARRLGLPLRTLAHKMQVLGIKRVGSG